MRFAWPDLAVDAPIENVGLDRDGGLAPPVTKRAVGWYELGWKPGSGHGNIIVEGHTYGDGTAVFKEDFGKTAKVGSTFWFEMDNGTRCSYRVSELFLSVAKESEFTEAAVKRGFFDGSGPERVFGVTCSGKIVNRSHLDVDAFFAEPTN